MQAKKNRADVIAKTLVLLIGGAFIGLYFFRTIKAIIIGAFIGFILSFFWQ